MAFGENEAAIRRVEKAIESFDKKSARLSFCIIILAIAQVYLGIVMLCWRH
jgi:hypothetical protein